MPYSTTAEVQHAAGGAQALIDLTDHDNSGSIDTDVLTRAQERADSLIDSYARQRYAVPFSPVPDRIRDIAAEETVYRLAVPRNAVSDQWAELHTENMEWLAALARGDVSPGEADQPTQSSNVSPTAVGNREAISDEQMSRDRNKGFW